LPEIKGIISGKTSVPKPKAVVRFRDFDFGTDFETEPSGFGLGVLPGLRNGRF
jgi:hypothetical protein